MNYLYTESMTEGTGGDLTETAVKRLRPGIQHPLMDLHCYVDLLPFMYRYTGCHAYK
jgi:hypothetical protein